MPLQAYCLLAGTGFKWLRLYDLRSRPGASSISCLAHAKVLTTHTILTIPPYLLDLLCLAHAKAVYGVAFDPFDDARLATYSDDAEGIVKVCHSRRYPPLPAATRPHPPLPAAARRRPGAAAGVGRVLFLLY